MTFSGLALPMGACLLALSAQPAVAAVTVTNLFSFDSFNDGLDPRPRLVQYTNGLFYGTASGGGPHGQGTVFRMTPDGVVSVLAAFNGTNGSEPYGGLMLARDGSFYGTTMNGGVSNQGTIFRITPEGVVNVLVSFAGKNGERPSTGLVQATDGNFYGTTDSGGTYGLGTAFKMTPAGELSTLVSFAQTNSDPMSGLVEGTDGNFYGTTRLGGQTGGGTVFRLTRAGDLTTLASFNSTNGYWPSAGLIQGTDGNFYGTTIGSLSGANGTVFRITTNGDLTTLIVFHGITDPNGSSPLASLMQATDGNLYGTTIAGGANSQGTVFRISPDGAFSSVYSFSGTNDGVHPRAELVEGHDGNLYGVTSEGGVRRAGNIFRLSVPMPPVLQGAVVRDGVITLSWSAVAGQTYQVEYCTDLRPSAWALLRGPLEATNGVMSATDSITADSQRFYRVGLLP